jgi:copper chaperone CopZ
MSCTETYSVVGMTCDHCARSVSAEVGALRGVTDVNVDLPSGQVTVTSEGLDFSQVRGAVEEAGYTLAP